MIMRLLLFGSNGMLGQKINSVFAGRGLEVITADRINAQYNFDFTDDIKLANCIIDVKPDVIVNTAAIVDLGLCEQDSGLSYRVNTRIPGILAELCRAHDIYLVQISTDHYFAEAGARKHTEEDKIVLVNEYARTKYLGEQLALTHENSLILRTNIVGFRGVGKHTFVEWVIDELINDSEMNLFTDFYTSSMHTLDFARILFDVINKRPNGVYNLASSDVNNKKDFVLALSSVLFNKIPRYKEATVNSINGPKRATSLGLDTSKIEKLVGYRMPGLNDTIESIRKEYIERRMK